MAGIRAQLEYTQTLNEEFRQQIEEHRMHAALQDRSTSFAEEQLLSCSADALVCIYTWTCMCFCD